jgi:hypothetical protein
MLNKWMVDVYSEGVNLIEVTQDKCEWGVFVKSDKSLVFHNTGYFERKVSTTQ